MLMVPDPPFIYLGIICVSELRWEVIQTTRSHMSFALADCQGPKQILPDTFPLVSPVSS